MHQYSWENSKAFHTVQLFFSNLLLLLVSKKKRLIFRIAYAIPKSTSQEEELEDFDDEEKDHPIPIPEEAAVKSTKRPLPRKRMAGKIPEDKMLDHAMSVLEAKSRKKLDADELFAQSIDESLKSIPDRCIKEYVKVKMQELVFQAHIGLLSLPGQINMAQTPYHSNNPSPVPSYTSMIASPLSTQLQQSQGF